MLHDNVKLCVCRYDVIVYVGEITAEAQFCLKQCECRPVRDNHASSQYRKTVSSVKVKHPH